MSEPKKTATDGETKKWCVRITHKGRGLHDLEELLRDGGRNLTRAPKKKATTKKTSHHFSLGNSVDGPIGFCARVTASSRREAVEKLKAVIPDDLEFLLDVDQSDGVNYLAVYINPERITTRAIDEEDEE